MFSGLGISRNLPSQARSAREDAAEKPAKGGSSAARGIRKNKANKQDAKRCEIFIFSPIGEPYQTCCKVPEEPPSRLRKFPTANRAGYYTNKAHESESRPMDMALRQRFGDPTASHARKRILDSVEQAVQILWRVEKVSGDTHAADLRSVAHGNQNFPFQKAVHERHVPRRRACAEGHNPGAVLARFWRDHLDPQGLQAGEQMVGKLKDPRRDLIHSDFVDERKRCSQPHISRVVGCS